jgi:hypothetical protein
MMMRCGQPVTIRSVMASCTARIRKPPSITPTLAQVASKESCAAADVSSGAKSYIVPPDESFEGCACSNEVRYTKGDVIG